MLHEKFAKRLGSQSQIDKLASEIKALRKAKSKHGLRNKGWRLSAMRGRLRTARAYMRNNAVDLTEASNRIADSVKQTYAHRGFLTRAQVRALTGRKAISATFMQALAYELWSKHNMVVEQIGNRFVVSSMQELPKLKF